MGRLQRLRGVDHGGVVWRGVVVMVGWCLGLCAGVAVSQEVRAVVWHQKGCFRSLHTELEPNLDPEQQS